MKTRVPALIPIILLLWCRGQAVTMAADGGKWQKFVDGYTRFDNKIKHFLMSGMDTNYVKLPETSWEIPVVGKVYGYLTNLTVDKRQLNLNTRPTFEVGAGIGYHGLDAVYTQAIGKALDFNFEFDYYDNYWGLGINIGRETFGPELYGEYSNSDVVELKCRTILLEGYYTVFGNRFSYPSTVYGNFIQKKSAGSPLITFWFEHRDYNAMSDRTRQVFADGGRSQINEGALLAGYGYNFAIAEGKAVINLSACAGVPLPYLGIATNGRAALMYWINRHCRLNLNVVNFYQKSWSDKNMRMQDNTWRAAISLTYCFGIAKATTL